MASFWSSDNAEDNLSEEVFSPVRRCWLTLSTARLLVALGCLPHGIRLRDSLALEDRLAWAFLGSSVERRSLGGPQALKGQGPTATHLLHALHWDQFLRQLSQDFVVSRLAATKQGRRGFKAVLKDLTPR